MLYNIGIIMKSENDFTKNHYIFSKEILQHVDITLKCELTNAFKGVLRWILKFYSPISLLFASANMALTTIWKDFYCCITFPFFMGFIVYLVFSNKLTVFVSLVNFSSYKSIRRTPKIFFIFLLSISAQLLNRISG